ncbi:hypothetical protein EYC80_004214 [Monilinia laxa]|uniref:Uncharacterized protein n=1 Tax=Monilinia laxa TaxID=61186 RepID=A0A5N6KMA8_MONLA|nr:hypothetical protein EYC80_004214 [Monilinia laxa]
MQTIYSSPFHILVHFPNTDKRKSLKLQLTQESVYSFPVVLIQSPHASITITISIKAFDKKEYEKENEIHVMIDTLHTKKVKKHQETPEYL